MSEFGEPSMSFFESGDNETLKAAEQQLDETVQELAHLDHMARRSVVTGDEEMGAEVAHRVGHILHNLSYGWTPTLIMHLAHHVNLARTEAGESAELFRGCGEDLKAIAIMLEDAGMPIDTCMKVLDLAHRMIKRADDSSFEPMAAGDDESE